MVTAAGSLVLAATLAFHPYAVGHAPAQAPTAPAPTATEPPPPAPAPKATAKPSEPMHEVVRPKTHSGAGLIAGAAVAGATAWGLTIGKIVVANRCNDRIERGGTTDDATATVYQCFTNVQAILGLSIGGWFANWAMWGLAAGGGGVRGKHDGVAYAWDGRPNRAPAGFIAGGATMFGVGVVGLGLARALALTTLLKCDVNPQINDCVTRRFRGYFAGVQAASMLVGVGLGTMVYGLVYRKQREMFQDRKVSDLRVVPNVSLYQTSGYGQFNGAALSGRF